MILWRRLRLLRWADASCERWSVRLWRWRDLESWGTVLLRRRIIGRLLDNLLLQILVLLGTLIHKVGLLARHGIVVRENTWLSSNHRGNDWLHVGLDLLLLVHVLWSDRRSRELLVHLTSHTKVHSLELLSSCLDTHELLLKSLLLLCKVHVGSNQLSVQVWIHSFLAVLINEDLRWSKNLFRDRVHLTVVVDTHLVVVVSILLAKEIGCLWSTVCLSVCINASTQADVMLLLGWWSSRREGARSSRLWCSSQTCKQVRSRCSRRRSTIVLWVGWLRWLE